MSAFSRRDLVLGGALLAGAAGAAILTPRGHLNLLGDRKLDPMIPAAIGPWRLSPSQSVVLPRTEGSLMAALYSQVLSRVYEADGVPAMMLVIAYGDTQSDLLQLHRPEACYAAVGFQIAKTRTASLDLAASARLPAREVVATRDDRVEPILYWTRIGDLLPDSSGAQRLAKLKNEMHGFVTDGVLVRVSTVADASDETFAAIKAFGRAMVTSMHPADRAVLIGRPLARAMA